MKTILRLAIASGFLLAASNSNASWFFDDNDGECWGPFGEIPGCNPYDEWDPRYWMKEMDDDDDYYGGPYGYGGYGGPYGGYGGPYGGYGGPGYYGAPYGGGYGYAPPQYAPPQQQYAPQQQAPQQQQQAPQQQYAPQQQQYAPQQQYR